MADPRNFVSFDGIDYRAETYKVDSTIVYDATQPGGSAAVGRAVTITGSQIVGLCADGDEIVGRLNKVEADSKATIQTGGYVQLPKGAAAAATAGTRPVGALSAAAKGYIRDGVAPADALVGGGAMIVDTTDANNPWVRLA